jgi:hypothetical protein
MSRGRRELRGFVAINDGEYEDQATMATKTNQPRRAQKSQKDSLKKLGVLRVLCG